MIKEFCIQYPVYAPGDKQYADDLAVIKIKDGDKITEKKSVVIKPTIMPICQKNLAIGVYI